MEAKSDTEIAKFLARQAEIQARRASSPALSPEWRWSRTGWGGWGGAASNELPPEPDADEAAKK